MFSLNTKLLKCISSDVPLYLMISLGLAPYCINFHSSIMLGTIILLHNGRVNLFAAVACSLSKTNRLGIPRPKATLGSSIECFDNATSKFSPAIKSAKSTTRCALSLSFSSNVTPCLPTDMKSMPYISINL